MIKKETSFLAMASLIFLLTSQASAESTGSDSSVSKSGDDSSATAPIAVNSRASARHSSFATKFVSVITGTFVGAPICAVRKPLDEDKYAVADITGNSKRGRAVIPAAVLWAPFSVVSGLLEAPFYALNNSLVNYDKPFSKEQISLKNPAASVQKEEELPIPKSGDVR